VISLVFGEVAVKWQPETYLYQRGSTNLWCQAFANNGASRATVLGTTFMQMKEVVFDVDSKRFGVVAADCPEYRRAYPPVLAQQADFSDFDTVLNIFTGAHLRIVLFFAAVAAVVVFIPGVIFQASLFCQWFRRDRVQLSPRKTIRNAIQEARGSKKYAIVEVNSQYEDGHGGTFAQLATDSRDAFNPCLSVGESFPLSW